MTASDAPIFFARLAALSELFDVKQFSEAKSELYFDALADIPIDAVIIALTHAAKSCTFMPRPAEIRRLALGDGEDASEMAWQWWKLQARRLGSYRTLETDDAALAETLVAVFGGWPDACTVELSPEMWASKRKEFGRVYSALRQRQLVGVRRLPGLCEQDNTAHGFIARSVDTRELTDGKA